MASEAVKKVLLAETSADRLNAEARQKAEDIVSSAHQRAVVAVQKKLAEAKAEADKIRNADNTKLAEYTKTAENNCAEKLDLIHRQVEKNTDRAVNAVIESFFS